MKSFLRSSISLSLLLASISLHVNALTLDDAMAHAYEHNNSLNAARENLRGNNEALNQALSGFLPSMSYKHVRQVTELNAYAANTNTDQPATTTTDDKFVLSQNLFSGGGSVAGVEAAKHYIKAKQAELSSIEGRTFKEVISAYLGVYIYGELTEASKKNTESIRKIMDAAQQKFKVGLAKKSEVSDAESRYAGSLSAQMNTEANYSNSVATFKNIVGLDGVEVEKIDDPKEITLTKEEVLKLALEKNPEYLQSKYAFSQRESEVKISFSQLAPQVNLEASVDRQRAEDRGSLELSPAAKNRTISLVVAIPIYQSGAEYSNVRKAKFTASSAKIDLRRVRSSVQANAQSILDVYGAHKAAFDAATKSLEAAQVQLESVTLEYQEGLADLTRFLDKQDALFLRQNEYLRAKKTFIESYYDVKMLIGELNAKDLGLKVNLYDPQKYVRYKLAGF